MSLLYAYGVARVGARAEAMSGGTRWIREGELMALVREVAEEEFGQAAIQGRLRDSPWLERSVREHARAVDDATKEGSLIPWRFATLFRSEDSLRQALRRNQPELLATFERLEGKEEWAVKWWLNWPVWESWMRESDRESQDLLSRAAQGPTGKSYLLRRQAERGLEQRFASRMRELGERIRNSIAERWESRQLSPISVTPPGPQRVVTLSVLVPHGEGEELVTHVKQLEEALEQPGWAAEVSGPFAPYSFVDLTEESECRK
jgi:hypothetical protein